MHYLRTLFSLLMLLVMGCYLPAQAQIRTAAQAEQIAISFLSQPRQDVSLGAVSHQQPSVQLACTSAQLLGQGNASQPAFYLFTPQDADAAGFIIVSGAEGVYPILGFSYTDRFDADQLPPAMRYLLGQYQAEIDAYLAHSSLQPAHTSGQRPSLPVQSQGVSPLISTRWSQDSPYNDLCPKDGNVRCPTGCSATSTAQLMKYYEKPSHGTGSISYTTSTRQIPVSFDFSAAYFQWSKMLDSYDSDYTSAQATAVAKLMAACGAAMQMDYTAGSSGASSVTQMTGLVKYLGYDTDIALLSRDYMTGVQWQTMILEELNNSHPVIMSGESDDGGHSFILDGYLNDNPDNPSYHVNWGWGGYYDNYFKVTALNPEGQGIGGSSGGYNKSQRFLYGCVPENYQTDHGCIFLGEKLSVSPNSATPNTSTSITISFQNFFNFSNKSFSGEFLFYLRKGSDEIYLNKVAGITDVKTLSGYSSYAPKLTVPSNLTEGTYEVIIKTKQSGSSLEQPMYWASGNPKLVVSSSAVYDLTWMIDDEIYLVEPLAVGQTIVPPITDFRQGYDFAWDLASVPTTMPDHDLTIHGYYTVGIRDIQCDQQQSAIYDLQGHRVDQLQPGHIYFREGSRFIYRGE